MFFFIISSIKEILVHKNIINILLKREQRKEKLQSSSLISRYFMNYWNDSYLLENNFSNGISKSKYIHTTFRKYDNKEMVAAAIGIGLVFKDVNA